MTSVDRQNAATDQDNRVSPARLKRDAYMASLYTLARQNQDQLLHLVEFCKDGRYVIPPKVACELEVKGYIRRSSDGQVFVGDSMRTIVRSVAKVEGTVVHLGTFRTD